MKKNCLFLIMFLVLIMCFSYVFATDFTITKSPQKINVNGVQKDFEVYNINGNNFFKLRDIAYVLNGTASQFSVNYDDTKRLIELQTSKSYISNGSEMNTGVDNSKSAIKSSQRISINGIEKELLAYNIAGNNFFKLRDLGTNLDFNVDYSEASNSVIIESKKTEPIVNITDVVAKIYNGIMYVELTSDTAINSYTSFPIYDTDSNRIVLDIANSNIKYQNSQVTVNYGGLTKVRIGNQGDNVNRFVLDIEDNIKYKVIQSPDKKSTYIVLSDSIDYAKLTEAPSKVLLVYNGETIPMSNTITDNTITSSGDKIIDNTITSSGDKIIDNNDNQQSGENENTLSSGPSEKDLKNRIKISSIKYSSSNNQIKIAGAKKFEYQDSKLESPYRIIIDIDNSVLDVEGPTSIKPNNKNITEIRFSQKDEMTVRVVIEAKEEIEYTIAEKNAVLTVTIDEPTYQNLTYVSKKDCAIITLKDVQKDVFSITDDTKNNKYTLKYSESRFSCGKETLNVDDDWVDTIKITTGKIVIQSVENMVFNIEQSGSDVIISVTKENTTIKKNNNSSDEFIVLLDAGHGGSDPGACNGDSYEKVYNLAIELKVKALLEESGVTVYCSRTKDTYLDRQDRVDFINSHDDADLFVSIHNNSNNNSNYNGTMVLYYDNNLQRDYGITSKEFAKIASTNLVSALNTKSWGIVSRNDLWVLTKSTMPAILCEVSFVSNDEELERLKTDKFQTAAAEAIYDSIMTAKKQMGK